MPRPRNFDHDAVVDAAMQAFWRGGLATTRVDEVLSATGLSRSSLYQCIGGRDTLAVLAIERYVGEQIARIERLFAEPNFTDAIASMMLDAALDNFGGRGCLLGNGVHALNEAEPDPAAIVRGGVARIAQALSAAIARARPDIEDPVQRCVEVMAALAGLRSLHGAGLPEARRREAARSFAAVCAR